EPTPSRYPRIADGTLVDLTAYQAAFPKIRDVNVPQALYTPLRLDFGPDFKRDGIGELIPPRVGAPYCTLVPAVDADGNERAGIRLPEIAVPLATFTGWNLRSERVGAAGALAR